MKNFSKSTSLFLSISFFQKRSKIILYSLASIMILSQLTGCATTVTKIPMHSKSDIMREETIQAELVRKKLALR